MALTLGSLVFVLLLAPWAEPLFVLAFGSDWKTSGSMAVWLLPLIAIRFVASPLSHMIYVAGKQPHDLIWQILLLVVTPLTLHMGDTPRSSILAYTSGASVLYLAYLLMTYRFSGGASK